MFVKKNFDQGNDVALTVMNIIFVMSTRKSLHAVEEKGYQIKYYIFMFHINVSIKKI